MGWNEDQSRRQTDCGLSMPGSENRGQSCFRRFDAACAAGANTSAKLTMATMGAVGKWSQSEGGLAQVTWTAWPTRKPTGQRGIYGGHRSV